MFLWPLLLWKRYKYYILWVWVCSLKYSAWNTQAPYCHLWLSGCTFFSTLSYKCHEFSKQSKHHNILCCVLLCLSALYLIIRKTELCAAVQTHWPSVTVQVVVVVRNWWNVHCIDRFSKKNSMDRQTDRHTYIRKIFTLLRKRIKFATLIGAQNEEKFYTLTSLTK